MAGINAVSGMNFSKVNFKQNERTDAIAAQIPESKADSAEFSTKVDVPKISKTRLAFSRLTDEQIAAVNKAGKLPEGAKFVANSFGGYTVCNNFFNLRAGTQQIPAGFELGKDILGFTVVKPIGTQGAFIKY